MYLQNTILTFTQYLKHPETDFKSSDMLKKELIKIFEPDIKAIHTESRRKHDIRIQQERSRAKKRKLHDTSLSSEDEDQQICAAAATFLIH